MITDIDGLELSIEFDPVGRNYMRNRTYGPEYPASTEPETVICRNSELCVGCPYPGHGFICWGADGNCMRSRIAKINQIEKEEQDLASDTL